MNAQGTPSADNIKYVACFNGAPFSFSQTLTELRDGIYEVTAGGYTEVVNGSPLGQYNYVGFLFANGMQTFVNTRLSNLLTDEELAALGDKAGNFVRVEDYSGESMGFAPSSTLGVANAIDAGHYDSRILVNVTDGKLTVGGGSNGALGLANNAYFGAFHLYYLGETESETAISGMDDVLASMQGIATHIMEDYVSDLEEYGEAPNFYQGLMNDLSAVMDEAATASTGASKYALIERFSDVFQSMAACKTAYSKLMKTINELSDAYGNLASTEEQLAIASTINEALDAYTEGSATEEEANDLIDMMQADPYYIRQYGNAALLALLNEAITLSNSVKADSRYDSVEGLKEAVDEMDVLVARINAGLAEKGDVNALKAAVANVKEILETGIEMVQGSRSKVQDGDVIYDLYGRRVEKAAKGIYITNGKKIFVK